MFLKCWHFSITSIFEKIWPDFCLLIIKWSHKTIFCSRLRNKRSFLIFKKKRFKKWPRCLDQAKKLVKNYDGNFFKMWVHTSNLEYFFFVKSVFCCLSITVLRKWGHSNKSAVHRVEGVWTIHGYDLCLSEILFQWIYLCRCIWWYELEN